MTSNNKKVEVEIVSTNEEKQVNPELLSLKIKEIAPHFLKPHPKNSLIYGLDEDVSDLLDYMRKSGWINPLVVTPNMTIISGHRRWKAARVLKLETVPIEIREFSDELSELEALLLENASRQKTTEAMVREAKAWEVIETEKALKRQIELAGSRPNKDLTANLPEGSKGETRALLAAKVGMKPRTYDKASKVVDRIDEEISLGNESYHALRQVLNNQSVDAAYKLITSPEIERKPILEKIAKGEAKTTTQAKRQLKLERCLNISTGKSVKFEATNITKELTPGLLVEISAPENPTIHDRLGRIAYVDGDFVEVWLRTLKLSWVLATYRVHIFQVTVVPVEKQPNMAEMIARIERLRECNLDPFEIDLLSLLDRPVFFTEKELKFLKFVEQEYNL